MNLLQAKIHQCESAAMELLNNCIMTGKIQSGATGSLNAFVARTGKLDNSANGPQAIPQLIDANPARSVSIEDINGANETWWRNRAIASTATTFTGYKREKNDLYNTCARGVGGPPDLIISDQGIWQVYFNSLQSQERYFITSQRIIDVLGGADDEALKFRGAVHIWDEVVPDVGTSTAHVVDNIGTLTNGTLQSGAHSTEYHINTDAWEYIVHPDADFVMTPFITPVNQDATISTLLWQGQLCVNNRRKHGVLYDLSNTINA